MTYNERIYREHKSEVFEIIYDTFKRCPSPKDFSILFGFDNPEAEQTYIEELNQFLEQEKPEVKRKFKELGFRIKEEN